MGILLFIKGMHPAAVFPVSVDVIHLGMAGFDKTSSQFRQAINNTEVQVERIQVMPDRPGRPRISFIIYGRYHRIFSENLFGRLRNEEVKAFPLERWPHKYPEVFCYLPFGRKAKVEIRSPPYQPPVEPLTQDIVAHVHVNCKGILVISVNPGPQHKEVMLQGNRRYSRGVRTYPVGIGDRLKRADPGIPIRVSCTNPKAVQQLDMHCRLQRNAKGLAGEPEASRIAAHLKSFFHRCINVGRNRIGPV